MGTVGALFLPWFQEVIRDEKVAVIFLKEFWSQIVGNQLAKSMAPRSSAAMTGRPATTPHLRPTSERKGAGSS